MTNLDKYVHTYREEGYSHHDQLMHAEDVAALKRQILHLQNLSDHEVQHLWLNFSDDEHCTLWAPLSHANIAHFEVWLLD